MPEINVKAVVVAAVAAFVISSAWYMLFAGVISPGETAGDRPALWKMGVELMRGLVLAAVIAGLASAARVEGLIGGLLLGFALWLGFPAVLWTGAMIWEGTPPRVAAIHAGDWLVKLPALAVIVTLWK